MPVASHTTANDRQTRKKITVALVTTEIVRWICLAVPMFLSIWVYARKVGYTVFISGWHIPAQFWFIVSLIFIAGSLLVYLPMKLVNFKYFHNTREVYGWRPSIVMYMILCGLPCFIIITVACRRETPSQPTLDSTSETVLQVVVFGLTLTEWMAKIREEVLSYDLITAMSVDFFFAYDVIEVLMMPSSEHEVYRSNWFFICMAAAWVAMAKYIPVQPASLTETDDPKPLVVCIMFSMFCNDIPFVIIRVTTMALFGLRASDIIHPLKNIALIGFNLAQLYIVWINRSRRCAHKQKISEKRTSRRLARQETQIEMKPTVDATADREKAKGSENTAYKQEMVLEEMDPKEGVKVEKR